MLVSLGQIAPMHDDAKADALTTGFVDTASASAIQDGLVLRAQRPANVHTVAQVKVYVCEAVAFAIRRMRVWVVSFVSHAMPDATISTAVVATVYALALVAGSVPLARRQ